MNIYQRPGRLTKEIVNKRIVDSNLIMLGECRGGHTKTLFTHLVCGHEWEATPSNVMYGRGCPKCGMDRRRNNQPHQHTKDSINAKISHKGIQLVGDYVNTETKSLMRCNKGHEWMALPLAAGCGECMKKSVDEVHEIVEGRGYQMIGEYLGMKKKTMFRCSEGHEWMTTPRHISDGSNCPSCSSTGFKPDLPAWIYILNFGGFIKYGITNSIDYRLRSHKRNGVYEIVATRRFEIGEDAKHWEQSIKRKFGGRYVDKSLCPDGWTETLSVDKLQLLLETVTK